MSRFIKLEFGFDGFRKRMQVIWSVLMTGTVIIVMDEDAFYDAISASFEVQLDDC